MNYTLTRIIYIRAMKLLIVLWGVIFILGCSSPIGEPVNKGISNSYYYHPKTGNIVYSPNGQWMNLGHRKVNADPKSFIPIAENLGKDISTIFYKQMKQDHVDRKTFSIKNGVIKDLRHVYVGNNDLKAKLKIVEDANPEYFEYIDLRKKKSTTWARDNKHYYYSHKKLNIDYKTFSILNDRLSADKYNIYTSYRGFIPVTKVTGVIHRVNNDYFTMGNSLISSNYRNAYSKIDFNEPLDIKIIDWFRLVVNNRVVAYGEFFKYNLVDASSFRVIKNKFTSDKNHVYYDGNPIPGADVKSFKLLTFDYAKDQNKVYFRGTILEDANPNTFKIEKSIGVDGEKRYHRHNRIDKN